MKSIQVGQEFPVTGSMGFGKRKTKKKPKKKGNERGREGR
jgi:hypothetical protein